MKLALLAGLLALALLGAAATANASPAHRDAVLGATDEWLAEVLRVPVADRADLPGLPAELEAGEAGILCDVPTESRYAPWLLREMADRSSLFFREAWATALHEHEHFLGGPCVYSVTSSRADKLDEDWLYFEEGFAEANRIDLYPAFMWRMFGMRASQPPMDRYIENVATVRALSRLATGSKTWRDRDARLWRRAGLLGSWDVRRALVAEAMARRPA